MIPELLLPYITFVETNKKLHCKKTHQLIQRVKKLCEELDNPESGVKFDATEPEKMFNFCANLHINLSGDTLNLLEWQRFLIACSFGFYTISNGVKRLIFNDVFLFIAKKNGKSSLVAALALYYLITQTNAQIIITACDYAQSKISFNYILDFIKFTPELSAAVEEDNLYVKESPPLTIVYRILASKILIVPETRAKQSQGFKPTVVIADEISSYRTNEILSKLSSGQVESNSIFFKMTTGETNLQNPGILEYNRAKQVLDGKFEATNYFPLIFELDEKDDWQDSKIYIKANPSVDITKPLTKMVEDRNKAIQSPVEAPAFRAYHLNQWLSSTTQGINDEYWNVIKANFNKYKEYLSEDKLKTYPAYASIDLSKIDDYTAYTIYFYIPILKKYYAKHHFYIPKGQIEKRLRLETEQISIWVKNGLITLTITDGTENNTVNFDYLKYDIIEDTKKYKLKGLGYDTYHATKLIEELEKENPKLIYSPFAMNWKSIAPANKSWLQDVYDGKIIDNNPVMDWMRSCAKFEVDRNNNIVFVKSNYTQSNERIDGVDTSVMAHTLLKATIETIPIDVEQFTKDIEELYLEY